MPKKIKKVRASHLISQGIMEGKILFIRGHRVMLDADLAGIYGVPTFRFNEAIKRNRHRFPEDFMFQLTRQEVSALTSQVAISKKGRGGRRTLPYAFTEHGALMAANILKSERAIAVSVYVVRAFVKMREILAAHKTLAEKLDQIEQKLTQRLDIHENTISEIIRQIRELMVGSETPKRKIGFHP